MTSGWNLWVWLECIGVVRIIITFPYSTCISSVFGSSIPISLFIFLCFFVLVYIVHYSRYKKQNQMEEAKRGKERNHKTHTKQGRTCDLTALTLNYLYSSLNGLEKYIFNYLVNICFKIG